MVLNKKSILLLATGAAFILVALTLNYHAVDNSLSAEDRQYIPKYLQGIAPLPEQPTYMDELAFIMSVQHSVLGIAPLDEGIPLGQPREPMDLYLQKKGLCFDRSRVLEKILRYAGFKTRHVAIYSTKETHSAIKSLLTPQIESHAVTEVLTKKGWLVVEAYLTAWASIDKNHNPVSLREMQSFANRGKGRIGPIAWDTKPHPSVLNIYENPFTAIYGLYSRHGYFYPPYDFIPDINYAELMQNWLY